MTTQHLALLDSRYKGLLKNKVISGPVPSIGYNEGGYSANYDDIKLRTAYNDQYWRGWPTAHFMPDGNLALIYIRRDDQANPKHQLVYTVGVKPIAGAADPKFTFGSEQVILDEANEYFPHGIYETFNFDLLGTTFCFSSALNYKTKQIHLVYATEFGDLREIVGAYSAGAIAWSSPDIIITGYAHYYHNHIVLPNVVFDNKGNQYIVFMRRQNEGHLSATNRMYFGSFQDLYDVRYIYKLNVNTTLSTTDYRKWSEEVLVDYGVQWSAESSDYIRDASPFLLASDDPEESLEEGIYFQYKNRFFKVTENTIRQAETYLGSPTQNRYKLYTTGYLDFLPNRTLGESNKIGSFPTYQRVTDLSEKVEITITTSRVGYCRIEHFEKDFFRALSSTSETILQKLGRSSSKEADKGVYIGETWLVPGTNIVEIPINRLPFYTDEETLRLHIVDNLGQTQNLTVKIRLDRNKGPKANIVVTNIVQFWVADTITVTWEARSSGSWRLEKGGTGIWGSGTRLRSGTITVGTNNLNIFNSDLDTGDNELWLIARDTADNYYSVRLIVRPSSYAADSLSVDVYDEHKQVTGVVGSREIAQLYLTSKYGIEYKLWGDVDGATYEHEVSWNSFKPGYIYDNFLLSEGHEEKTVYARFRDFYENESAAVAATFRKINQVASFYINLDWQDIDVWFYSFWKEAYYQLDTDDTSYLFFELDGTTPYYFNPDIFDDTVKWDEDATSYLVKWRESDYIYFIDPSIQKCLIYMEDSTDYQFIPLHIHIPESSVNEYGVFDFYPVPKSIAPDTAISRTELNIYLRQPDTCWWLAADIDSTSGPLQTDATCDFYWFDNPKIDKDTIGLFKLVDDSWAEHTDYDYHESLYWIRGRIAEFSYWSLQGTTYRLWPEHTLLWNIEKNYALQTLLWDILGYLVYDNINELLWDINGRVDTTQSLVWDILDHDPVTKQQTLIWDIRNEITGYNHEAQYDATTLEPIYAVFIDNIDVTDLIVSASIDINIDNNFNTVDLKFDDFELYRDCDTTTDFGKERITIIIGSDEHRFLLEERDTDLSPKSANFSVWGRSKNALLDMPYMEPINDEEGGTHPWQGADPITAKEAIDYCISYYNSSKPAAYESLDLVYDNGTDNFFQNHYIIWPQTFNVDTQSLARVIQDIISDFAFMRWDYEDGKIHIDFPEDGALKWPEGLDAAVANFLYTSDDHIVQLGEEITHPEGYNYVLITGVEEPTDTAHFIEMEDDSDFNPDTEYLPGEAVYIAMYTYPFNMTVETEISVGTFKFERNVVKEITEEITFEDLAASTQRPVYSLGSYTWKGADLGAITFDQDRKGLKCENDGCAVAEVTYTTRYHLYKALTPISYVGQVIICATEVVDV